ncbi:MAG: gliding motility-associated C-terminal domain-containing protein [Saprospiraceae bacterium]|nr:gliding motility-associated C-terminal domain-containing protein [Saprospiraceae bacterium]
MFRSFYLIIAFLSAWISVFAQPANDDCANAQILPDVTNWCSGYAAYTNVGATPSGYGSPTCIGGALNDVWFTFVAQATDISIIVNGSTGTGSGGTLLNPRVVLYSGVCGGVINELECGQSNFNHIIEIYKGGLIIGETYLIRVMSVIATGGTFELCINNYNSPVEPTSDCPQASILCDKSPFVVQSVTGAGSDITELDDATCFNNGSPSVNNESNSTWFTWICDQAGPLEFTLTPNNPSDDIDFVLYELPNGIADCNNKKVLRCMASGDFVFPSKCMGPTGLKAGETDISEPAGCANANQSNFLAPLLMEAGKTYALGINNFTSTGNGFSVEWGGTGTFRGPEAAFVTLPSKPGYCIGEAIQFQDASTFELGQIISYTWYFGLGSSPSTATGPGWPVQHEVTYSTAGTKSIALVVETNLGCIVTTVQTVNIGTCCDDFNAMHVVEDLTHLDCFGDSDGAIDLTVTSATPTAYQWTTGQTLQDIAMLSAGSYTVTITNEATCDTVLTYEITSPPLIEGNPLITKPTCDGGQDGAILLQTTGGVPPYLYDWQDGSGFVTSNSLTNIPVGLYFVTIRDANDCEVTLAVDVRELELLLDPAIQAVVEPSCFGYSDGQITMTIINGLPPYEYNFNNTGWTTNNSFSGLSATTSYTVEVRDANNCIGYFVFHIGEPDPLVVDVTGTDISCFGADDGQIQATVTGGTEPYAYLWSDGQTDDLATGLPPGSYMVTVTDDHGCTAVNGTNLIQPPQLFLDLVEVIDVRCFGEANGSLTVSGTGGTPGYLYSIDGGPFQGLPAFENLKAGDYAVTVMDEQGCQTTIIVTVNQPPPLLVDAGADVTIDLGYSTPLSSTVSPPFTPVSTLWTPVDSLVCETCSDIDVAPVNTTTFTVTIVDSSGCMASDMVTVIVNKIRDIYIPNAFSPDGNGINDVFTIYGGIAAESVLVFRIYNRWGGLIYEGTNFPLNSESDGWRGIYKGEYLNPDVFAFYALIRFIDDEEIIYKGDIQLTR